MFNCAFIANFLYKYKKTNNPAHINLFKVNNRNTSTLSQVSNCDGVVLEIYLNLKSQWRQEGLNCECHACEAVT